MDSYLFSIINLYLNNESDDVKTNLVIKKQNENIYFSFGMTNNSDTTKFFLPFDVANACLERVLLTYKDGLIIIDEKYNSLKKENICNYYVLFNNGRSVSFEGFNVKEINIIRNYLYKIQINKEKIRVNINEDTKVKFKLSYAGFATYKTFFFITIFFLDLLFVTLWICKAFLK